MYSGQTKCVRYYMNFHRAMDLAKECLLEVRGGGVRERGRVLWFLFGVGGWGVGEWVRVRVFGNTDGRRGGAEWGSGRVEV